MSPEEALERAEEAGMDLVMVAPNAEPPVCKLLDYRKARLLAIHGGLTPPPQVLAQAMCCLIYSVNVLLNVSA